MGKAERARKSHACIVAIEENLLVSNEVVDWLSCLWSSSLIVLTQERSHGRRRQVAEKPASRTGGVAFPVKCLKSRVSGKFETDRGAGD